MKVLAGQDDDLFRDTVQGLKAGDFSRLEPLFRHHSSEANYRCRIIEWVEQGRFVDEPIALQEALTCACFLGCTEVVEYLLTEGVDPLAGTGTGLDGLHWAANRGQLEIVKLFIRRQASLETRSMYGGTVLGTTVWAAVHEPKADHLQIIEALIKVGARLDEAGYPTGNERVDEVLQKEF